MADASIPKLRVMRKVRIDLTGIRFGRLLVTSLSSQRTKDERHRPCWNCVCDCGTLKVVPGQSLRGGHTSSCGCLHIETARNNGRKSKGVRRHGFAGRGKKTAEYHAWRNAKERCHNPKNDSYFRYGARGISVCDRWRNSFESFFADMGHRPSSRHSLDRKNNNGNYEPGNCRWATRQEQARNTRRGVFVIYKGTKMPLIQASIESGISSVTLHNRIKANWPEDRIFVPKVYK